MFRVRQQSRPSHTIRSYSRIIGSIVAACVGLTNPTVSVAASFSEDGLFSVYQVSTGNSPRASLQKSYRRYIAVKECFDSRVGYAQIYVSDEQMNQAKQSIIAIEAEVKKISSEIDTDAVWAEATEKKLDSADNQFDAVIKLVDSVTSTHVRDGYFTDDGVEYCNRMMSDLRSFASEIAPRLNMMRKDF